MEKHLLSFKLVQQIRKSQKIEVCAGWHLKLLPFNYERVTDQSAGIGTNSPLYKPTRLIKILCITHKNHYYLAD